MNYDDLKELGSEAAVKAVGLIVLAILSGLTVHPGWETITEGQNI